MPEPPKQKSLRKAILRRSRLKQELATAQYRRVRVNGTGYIVNKLREDISACEEKILRLEEEISREETLKALGRRIIRQINSKAA